MIRRFLKYMNGPATAFDAVVIWLICGMAMLWILVLFLR